MKDILLFGFSIILMSLSIFFRDDQEFATLLFVGGILILIASLSVKYFPLLLKSYQEWRIKPIYFKADLQTDKITTPVEIEKIFELAAREGGELFTTSILHKELPIADDLAIKYFKNVNPSTKLIFKRLLLADNVKNEYEALKVFFTSIQDNKPEKFETTIYIFKKLSFFLSPFISSYIPRINMILYKTNNDRKYRLFVGFDRLYGKDKRFTSVGFLSESKGIYEMILPYFQNLISQSNLIHLKSYTSFEEEEDKKYSNRFTSNVLSFLVKLAFEKGAIQHIGIFGSEAKTVSELYGNRFKEKYDTDLDILILVTTTKAVNNICKEITKQFDDEYEIVWGDDNNYYYHFRNPSKPPIDIEIKTVDSNFYLDNSLLGISVFSYYYNLYITDGFHISDLISLPDKSLPHNNRLKLFINDRKGLNEFINKLENYSGSKIDPRRILSLAIRNFVWVESGSYPYNHFIAIDYLKKYEDYHSILDIKTIEDILITEKDDIENSYKRFLEKTIKVLIGLKEYLNSKYLYNKQLRMATSKKVRV